MTINECYEQLGGNYEDTVTRLMNEAFLKRIVSKFLEDKSMSELQDAYEKGDCEACFRAAHTLKGLALNLGFPELQKSSSELTEKLRLGSLNDTSEEYKKLILDYEYTIDILDRME